ncbi:MAG: M61 family metallopeptidase [Gammaproteobacteria bacterium]|nr:M61 family metallopeptidase [Gammaproteobacteria bacterium]
MLQLGVAQAQDEVSYRLNLSEPAHQLGRVEARFPAVPAGAFDVQLPAWRTGKYQILNLASGLRGVSASDASGRSLPVAKVDKNTWRVEVSAPGDVILRYEVYANQLAERVRHIDESHAFLDASGIFLGAEAYRRMPLRVDLEVPAGWTSRSGMDLAGPHAFRAPNYDVLIDSPIETGLHEFRRFQAGGREHELVVWGKGNYDLAAIQADLAKFAPEAEKIWGDFPFQRYVWMIHAGTELRGATEHLNSTIISRDRWAFAPREDYVKFIRTAAHEFVHTWNVKAYRPDGLVPYDYRKENYSRLLWVAEGTTSYFEGILALRAGVITPKEFLKELGSLVDRHRNRPGRLQQSVAEASFDEWLGDSGDRANNASVNIYDQGELVSLALDLEIRARTGNKKGLQDVHRLLFQRFPAARQGYSEADVLGLLKEVSGADFAEFWAEHVRGVKELPLANLLAAAGLELKYEADKDDKSKAEAAFTGLKTQVKEGMLKLELVQRDSPAWKAGLAAGDQLLAIDSFRVDPAKAEARLKQLKPGQRVELSVFRGDELKTLSLTPTAMPRGKFTVATKAKPSSAEKARFKAWLGISWPDSV